MSDLFEGFKWREVAAVIVAMVFFVSVIITGTQDIRITLHDLSERLHKVEIRQVAAECAINPELCRMLER